MAKKKKPHPYETACCLLKMKAAVVLSNVGIKMECL